VNKSIQPLGAEHLLIARPLLRVLLKQPLNEPAALLPSLGKEGPRIADGPEEFLLSVSPEGIIPLHEQVDQHAQAPPVRQQRDVGRPAYDLGGHVGWGAAVGFDLLGGLELEGEAEVD
jgi:hypothetical protein